MLYYLYQQAHIDCYIHNISTFILPGHLQIPVLLFDNFLRILNKTFHSIQWRVLIPHSMFSGDNLTINSYQSSSLVDCLSILSTEYMTFQHYQTQELYSQLLEILMCFNQNFKITFRFKIESYIKIGAY